MVLQLDRLLGVILFIAGFCTLLPRAICQDIAQPTGFDREAFSSELMRLAGICAKLDLPERQQICENWLVEEREDREVLYLPETGGLAIQPGPSVATRSWSKHFLASRKKYAEFLAQDLKAIAAEDEQAGYRRLWQILRNDPDHKLANQIAGPMAKAPTVRPRLTVGRTKVPDFGWEARSYSRVDSIHFTLLTRADAKSSREIAQQLEQFYVLWSQVFYPYWAAPGVLQARLDGKSNPWPKHDRIEVVLLKDRAEYLRILGVAEDNIGVSVGYYGPEVKKCFCYPAENLQATLFHELTHQLLMEVSSIRPDLSAGKAGGIWMLEGIALYMESLRNRDGFWTLGGWDASRMQTARYRGVRDGYWPDWEVFSTGGMDAWKQDPAISRLYTHSVGLTQTLLHACGPQARKAYLRELVNVYHEENQSGRLSQQLASSDQEAKKRYQDLLIVQQQQIANLHPNERDMQDLVLCGSQFTPAVWQSLNMFNQLEWLDVSFSNVRDEDLKWIGEKRSLKRISVEGSAATAETIASVRGLPKLEELDLSGCAIDDAGLQQLQGHPTLQTLWLTQTQITQAALPILKSMPKLRTVDIGGTKIDDATWQKFLADNPRFGR
ncbi:MAG: hypothetical protein AAF483_13635 [Planctomycetota bacterium]